MDDLELEGEVPKYQTPGVYREDIFEEPSPELRTGVPAFLGIGIDKEKPVNTPQRLTMWSQFVDTFGDCDLEHGYLAYAVRGFFQNGGELCCVMCLKDSSEDSMCDGLAALASIDTIDLVCAPDIMPENPDQVVKLQKMVLDHCDTSGDRFAILDAQRGTQGEVLKQKESLSSANGALYYPWLNIGQRDKNNEVYFIPPCGHVAGVFARSDRQVGVHKAPANEILDGVLGLDVALTDADQNLLNLDGVNGLRAFPGRGIRVWGARTLAPKDTEWAYINVRRLFLTARRWIEHMMSTIVFEPNDARLWVRIERELTAYFDDLFRRGALQGSSPQEAFYVKCNAETNPPEVRELGQVITEIGLAPTCPAEFVVVRIIHGASGVNMVEPARLEQQT